GRLVFFFSSRRRHTRSDRDWSSDVCSSDLLENWNGAPTPPRSRQVRGKPKNAALISSEKTIPYCAASPRMNLCSLESPALTPLQIGRASCRERLQLSGAGGPVNKKATTSTT